MKIRLSLWFCLLLFSGAALAQPTPDQVVRDTAGAILDKLTAQRSHFETHPEELEQVVANDLMPLFDLTYSARLILGRHGRGVSAEQIENFAQAMSNLLISRYADGLLEFNSKDQLDVLPLAGKNTDRLTRVRTRIKLENGTFAPVDYAFRNTEEGWKAFDVTVEGISYVTTYRNQIGPQVQAEGLDSVIRKLNSGEVKLND